VKTGPFAFAAVIVSGVFMAFGQSQSVRRPLTFLQSHYRLRAGDRVALQAPSETLTFMLSARTRSARASGESDRSFPVASNVAGDQVLLGVPLTTLPGDYSVAIAFVNEAGQEGSATFQVTVEPFATAGSGVPPVVLLDGWQQPGASACPMYNDSIQTFGNLQSYLGGSPNFVPAVYFFENCTECPNCTIEQLGADLGAFINSIHYSDGTPVPQVDVVAHSMGGLIVRSYLSGKQQASGAFSPPGTPKIRKAVFIGTPHFGSFQADSLFADIAFGLGNQTNEMKRGSQFVWDLATWNQFGDDLRGVDALAVIGNAGSYGNLSQASDGVVALSSGSLDFVSPGRTRVVNYCHVPLTTGLEADYLGCVGPGIANIDSPSHPTYQIVSSFLIDGTAWQGVGNSSAQDQYLSQYGGMVVADVSASDQFAGGLSGVSWGSVNLSDGAAAGELYYNDFVNGTASFAFGASSCGPFTETAGVYSAVRCKFGPSAYAVGPLLPGTGIVVQAGSTITISGAGFGAQQCSACQVTASNPQSSTLQISSWSDTAIGAFLPSSFGVGIVRISVTTASGYDAINIMAGTVAVPPAISLSTSSLSFAFTMGNTTPPAQSVSVANTGGGTLTYSVASNSPWLITSASGSLIAVSVNPAGLTPNSYQGAITVASSTASNSPQTVAVRLTVIAQPTPPSISLSTAQANFTYTVGGTVPAPQTISISNSGGGTFTWSAAPTASWIRVSSASNSVSISVNPTSLSPGRYTGTVSVTATGASNSPQSIAVNLTVAATAPTVVVSAVVNSASGASGAIAPGEMVSIFGSGLGPDSGVSFSLDPKTGMVDTALGGTQVFFGSAAAPITYASATQVNAIVPYEIAGQVKLTMQVQFRGATSSNVTLAIAVAAPGAFTLNSSGSGQAVAANQNYSLNDPTSPAPKGSYVTIYFTGGGQTNPPAVTGSVNGSKLQWLAQSIHVTLGGVPATVQFDGAAPGLVAGVCQLNVQVPSNALSGPAQPVVITVGGVSSPATATIAVE